MGNATAEAFTFLLDFFFDAYALLLTLRFIMQWFRVDYYNPLAQFVVKATDPVLKPVRRVIKSIGSYDTSSILLAFVTLVIKMLVFKMLSLGVFSIASNASMPLPYILAYAFRDLVQLFFTIFIYSLIGMALLSWFPNPATDGIRSLLHDLTRPILTPFRRYVPPMGGLDLSVLFAVLALIVGQIMALGVVDSIFAALLR